MTYDMAPVRIGDIRDSNEEYEKALQNSGETMAWRKGQSGNPNGRPPKEKALTTLLEQCGNVEEDGKTRKQRLAEELWALALNGDLPAIKYIYDRLDGKPRETMDVDGSVGGTLIIVRPGDELQD